MSGRLPGFQARISSMPPQASASPAAPPITASSTLSVSNWRTRRPRPAPRLSRSAISRSRTVARASIRLATLTTAISSTSPTAPASTRIAGFSVAPSSASRRPQHRQRQALVVGVLLHHAQPDVVDLRLRLLAASRRVSAARRRDRTTGRTASAGFSGRLVQTSVSRRGKRNAPGITPITVEGAPFTRMVWPSTPELAAKRLRQIDSLSTASEPAAGWSSPARESPADQRSALRAWRRSPAVTDAPCTCSGTPSLPPMSMRRLVKSEGSSNARLFSFHIR